MVFGDKKDFAIEAMIEPDLKPPTNPWGRMCVWISGFSIGNYEDPHCGLGTACDAFVETCEILNELWLNKFYDLSDREIWNFLDGTLYGFHGNEEIEDDRTLNQTIADSREYSKFNFLTNWGEMFDRGGKSFLLKHPSGYLMILNYNSEKDEVARYICSEFCFRKATKDFSVWFNQQTYLLSGKNA